MPHTVLVVDDRPEVRQTLSDLLQFDDRLTVVGTAVDGVDAMEHARRDCPDAIILDLEMPRMDGLEALPRLRQACPNCAIVMYSSDADRAKVAPQLGADAVADKAESPLALIDLVVNLCRIKGHGGAFA